MTPCHSPHPSLAQPFGRHQAAHQHRVADGVGDRADRQKAIGVDHFGVERCLFVVAERRRKVEASPPLSDDEKAAFYARMVNSDCYLPVSVISNTIRDAMLARGLVTTERLRQRGVR